MIRNVLSVQRRRRYFFKTTTMNFSARLIFFPFSFLLSASFFLSGCGDANEAQSPAERTDSLPAASADPGMTGVAASFRQGMINLSKRMLEIAQEVNSVEDAQAAEPKLAQVMEDITALLNRLADNVEGMSREEMNAIENMRNDPELQDWTRRVNEAMGRLEKENPEAMQALQEIGRRQSEKMRTAMRELRQKIDNRMGSLNGDGSAEQPRVTPDSAK